MPKVEIKRTDSKSPSGVQDVRAKKVEADTSVGSALSGLGQTVSGIGAEIARKEQLAEDSSYVANTSIQADKASRELSETLRTSGEPSKGHTERFEKELGTIYTSLLDKAPSDPARRALESQLAGYTKAGLRRESAFELGALDAERTATYEESVTEIGHMLETNPEEFEKTKAQHEQLLEALSVGKTNEELQAFRDRDQEFLAARMIRGIENKDPEAAIELLEGGGLDDTFSPTQVDSLIKHAKTTAKNNLQDAIDAAAKEKKAFVDSRQLEIFRGDGDQLVLDKDLQDGKYSSDEYISLSKELANSAKVKDKATQAVARVEITLDKGEILNTRDSKTKSDLDVYYDKTVQSRIDSGEITQDEGISIFVDQFGYVPKKVRNNLVGSLYRGSVSQQSEAATSMSNIIERDPTAARLFGTTTDLPRMDTIANGIRAGLKPKEAVQAADNLLVDKNTSEYDSRLQAYQDTNTDLNISAINNIQAGGGYLGPVISAFKDEPNKVPGGLTDDYNRLVRAYSVDLRKSPQEAIALANKIIASRWIQTEVNGEKQYMKDAPEIHYNKRNLDPVWIRDQLVSEVEPMIPFENKVYSITPDPLTINSEEGPAYQVFYETENGVLTPLVDESDPKRPALNWRPDITISETAKKEQSDKELKAKAESLVSSMPRPRSVQEIEAKAKTLERIEGNIQSIREGF